VVGDGFCDLRGASELGGSMSDIDKADPEPELEKPPPEPEPWERATIDVPMTISDIELVRIVCRENEIEIPEDLEAAMDRAYATLDFIRALTTGGYRASGPSS
jgi:hypothetical protein